METHSSFYHLRYILISFCFIWLLGGVKPEVNAQEIFSELNSSVQKVESKFNAEKSKYSNVYSSASTFKLSGDGSIDFIGTDPATTYGAILVDYSNVVLNSDGTATAEVEVKNVTSLWYKLYIEPVGNVDFSFTPGPLEDANGYLSPA